MIYLFIGTIGGVVVAFLVDAFTHRTFIDWVKTIFNALFCAIVGFAMGAMATIFLSVFIGMTVPAEVHATSTTNIVAYDTHSYQTTEGNYILLHDITDKTVHIEKTDGQQHVTHYESYYKDTWKYIFFIPNINIDYYTLYVNKI